VLISSRPSRLDDPGLADLPVTILQEFGLKPISQMSGRTIYGARSEVQNKESYVRQ
jgi:hypothetical protein